MNNLINCLFTVSNSNLLTRSFSFDTDIPLITSFSFDTSIPLITSFFFDTNIPLITVFRFEFFRFLPIKVSFSLIAVFSIPSQMSLYFSFKISLRHYDNTILPFV